MKITPKSIADLYRLGALPGARRIFLRSEYDKQEKRLKKWAGFYRRHFLKQTRIVAVVGSLGKTTTRQAVALALNCPAQNFSYSNYGSNLAGNLLRVQRRDKYAVLEAGIGGPGRMAGYAEMIRPDIVVVTSVKSEHNRSFPTLLDTRREKVKMVSVLSETGIAVLNGDDENVRWMASQTRARVIMFGMNASNDIRADKVDLNDDGTANLTIQVVGRTFQFHSPLVGPHMIYPILAAIAVAHAEKIDIAGILPKLAGIVPPVSRMEWHTLPDGTRILDDSFKSSQDTIDPVMETFSKMAGRKIIVMGKIDEPMGKTRDRYREVGTKLAAFADYVLCIGGEDLKSLRAAAVDAGMDALAIKILGSRLEGAHEWLRTILQPGDLVLLKGSINQKFRRILLQLMGKPVGCRVKLCEVKVATCDCCPLLNAPESFYQNYFISRYIEL
ncbi:MAG TPA: Mur ligase family protein [Pseudomonadales bacterium]|nr:Mur ligase family protein [Pseudomonadales bacterium]